MSTPKVQYELHDHCMAGARAIVDIVAPCLRDEELRELFELAYEILKATLTSFDEKVMRTRSRIPEPSKN